MKKGIYILLIGLLSIIISVAYSSLNYHEAIRTPDSGWDYDYDSGSSWDDGGSSWDSSSSSYDSNSSNQSSFTNTEIVVFMILTIIFIIFLSVVNIILSKSSSSLSGNSLYDGEEYDYLRKKLFEIYKEVQYAWSNFEYKKLRKLLSDELYNNYVTLLEQLKEKQQQNIMSDIELVDIAIQDIKEFDDLVQYDIQLIVNQVDYVINTKNNKVVRGNEDINEVQYKLTYTMSKNQKNTCPNCGTKLDSVASQICPSCGSTIVSDKHDIIMIKKEIIKQ